MLILLGHVIAYSAVYIGGNLCHGMHDPLCDDELSRATMRSAVLVCGGHMLLKLGARNDMAHFQLIPSRQDQEYAKLIQQQDDVPQHSDDSTFLDYIFRCFRVIGALLVCTSLLLNVMLILVSNKEISMSSWETVTP